MDTLLDIRPNCRKDIPDSQWIKCTVEKLEPSLIPLRRLTEEPKCNHSKAEMLPWRTRATTEQDDPTREKVRIDSDELVWSQHSTEAAEPRRTRLTKESEDAKREHARKDKELPISK